MGEQTLPPGLQQEAFELERDDAPAVRPSVAGNPNYAKSEVVHVRLSQADLASLQAAADDSNRSVSDVVRAAIRRYLVSDR